VTDKTTLPPSDTPLWTMSEVCAYVRKSDSWVYERIHRQKKLGITSLFPMPVPMQSRSCLFAAEDVKAWVQKFIDASRKPSKTTGDGR
jgi:predicted DNA-binding transcriptional regulator AlpA